jgi:hypothetical protein
VFALIGLVVLVSVLVLGEMFERAIQDHREEHDSFDPASERDELR